MYSSLTDDRSNDMNGSLAQTQYACLKDHQTFCRRMVRHQELSAQTYFAVRETKSSLGENKAVFLP